MRAVLTRLLLILTLSKALFGETQPARSGSRDYGLLDGWISTDGHSLAMTVTLKSAPFIPGACQSQAYPLVLRLAAR